MTPRLDLIGLVVADMAPSLDFYRLLGVEVAPGSENAPHVDATHSRVVAAGHESHLEPWDAFRGQRCVVVHDPDGNSIDQFAALGCASGTSSGRHRGSRVGCS